MNEEAIKYSYELFVKDGYSGTESQYRELLSSNKEAVDYAYELFKSDGYSGELSDFEGLIGYGKKKVQTTSQDSTTTAEQSVSEAPSTEKDSEPYTQQPQQEFMEAEQVGKFGVTGQQEPKTFTIDEKYAERQRVEREVKQQNEKVAYNSGKSLLYNNINKDYLSITQQEIDESLNTVSQSMMQKYGIGLSAGMRQQLENDWRNKSDISTAKKYYETVSPEIIGEFLPQEELISFSTTKTEPTPRTFTQMQEAYVVDNIFTPEQTRLFAAIKSGNKELADQLRGTPNLYDPTTGKLTEEPNKETAKYEYEVDTLADEYSKTSKDKLEDLFLTKSAVYRTLQDRYNATLFESDLELQQQITVSEDIAQKLKTARKELDAASRAFLLNQDPAYVETGVFERITGYSDVVDLITYNETASPTEYQKAYESMAPVFDIPLTDKQKEEFEDTFSEKAIDAFSETIPIMGKIGIASVALNKIGATGRIAKIVKEIENKYGKYAEFWADLAAQSAIQTATFTYAGQGYETALGEAFGQKTIETIVSPIVGKYGKLANALIKMGGGNVGEFVAEYSGELLSALNDSNINVEQAFEQTFGREYDEATDKALLTFFMTTMFSGAANLPNVGGAVIDLMYSQPEVNSNKDAQKMYDEYKKNVTLSSTVGAARQAVNKVDRDIELTEEEVATATEQLQKALDEVEGMELAEGQKAQIKQSLQDNLKKIQDAIQKPSTEEMDVRQQTEDGEAVGEQDTQETITEEGQAQEEVTPEQQEEVIEQVGEDKVPTVGKVLSEMQEAKYIADEDVETAKDELISAIDEVENSDLSDEQKRGAINVIESLYGQIDSYEFRTKKKAGETATKATVSDTRKAAPRLTERDWQGKSVEINGEEGKVSITEDGFTVQKENGETETLDSSMISGGEGSVELDADGNVSSFSIKTQDGNTLKVTDPDLALDLAIRDRMEKVGEVPDAVFEEVYNEVTQREEYVKERPTTEQETEQKQDTNETEEITTKQQPVLEELQTSGNQDEGGQEGTELRTETEEKVTEPTSAQPKTGTEVAKQRLIDKWKAAQDFRRTLGADPFSKAEEQARLDREAFDALVDLVKEYIKEGVKTAKEFAQEVSNTVDETLANLAFNVAQGKQPSPNTTKLQKLINKSVEGKASKTAEKVTMSEYVALKERIKNFARGVREGSKIQKEAAADVVSKIKDLATKGTLSAKQAAALTKRAASINFASPKAIQKFNTYAEKVFTDAEYADKLSEAKSLQDKAKKKLKSKSTPAGQKQLLADIVNTNLDAVDDLDAFNEVVSDYMRSFLPVTNKNYKVADIAKAQEYIDSIQPTQTESQQRLEDELGLSGLTEAEAEEVLNFMEQQDADTYQDNLTEAKQKSVSDALSKVAEYSKLALKEAKDVLSGLSDKKKGVLSDLLDADISLMTNAQKAAYAKIADNIIANNDWSASGALAAEIAGQKAAQNFDISTISGKTAEIGGLLGSVGRYAASYTFGVSAMFRSIYGLGKAMIDVQYAMGLSEYFRKFYKYRNEIEDVLDLVVRFQKDATKKYKNFNDTENRMAEGMFGFAVQPMDGASNSLDARKKIIEQDLKAKKDSGDKKLMEEAEVGYVVYSKLFDGAKTVDDVIANMKKYYRGNYEFWNFVSESLLPQYTETLSEYSVMDKNENVPYDLERYTPITYSRLEGQEVELSPEKQYEPPLKDIKNIGKASATKKRTDPKNLPKEKIINYDLRTGTMRSISDGLFDAMLSSDIIKMNSFLGTSKATSIFGGINNKRFVQEKINAVIKSQRGDFSSQSAGERIIRGLNTKLKKYGALRALGGFTQAIKQPVDIMVNSFFSQGPLNLGEGIRILAMDKDASKLLDQFSIGARGGVKGGIVRKTLSQDIAEKTRQLTPTKVNTFIANAENVMDVPLFALSKSDATAAKASWLGYYVQYLKGNGINVMDMATESQAVRTDPIRAKAAVYAETMVDIYQVESETSKMAEFAKTGSKSLLTDIVKNVLMPFSSFSVGQRVRINSDLRDIFIGRNVGAASKSLLGTTMAIGAFHATSVYVISMIKDAGADALNALLGGDDEDDDPTAIIAFTSVMEAMYTLGLNDADIYRIAKQAQKQALQGKESDIVEQANMAFKFKKLYSSIARDMIASGYSSFAEESFIDAMNATAYLYLAKINDPSVLKKNGELMKYDYWMKYQDKPFYRYKSKSTEIPFMPNNVGIYDVITDRPVELYEQVNTVIDPEAAQKEAREKYERNEKRAAERLGKDSKGSKRDTRLKKIPIRQMKMKEMKIKEIERK